jgi:hypothetical protein
MTCRYFGISRPTYYTWLRRYEADGVDGLRDQSKRPRTSPNATRVEVVEKIIHLRQHYYFGPGKIQVYLKRYHDVQISQSGVWRSAPATTSRSKSSSSRRCPRRVVGVFAVAELGQQQDRQPDRDGDQRDRGPRHRSVGQHRVAPWCASRGGQWARPEG